MEERLKKLNCIEMEPFESELPTKLPPGGGLSRFILQECTQNMPCLCLTWFATEGGN